MINSEFNSRKRHGVDEDFIFILVEYRMFAKNLTDSVGVKYRKKIQNSNQKMFKA